MIKRSDWVTIEKPGWFGEDRGARLREYDEKYGVGNWRIRHQLGPRVIDLSEAVSLYELSYELHFLNPHTRYIWASLFKEASEVWTEEESDIESGTDYSIQKSPAVHYEDQAIRRIMLKYGKKFEGAHLVRTRGDSPDVLGVALSSIHVPFVLSEFIEPHTEVCWWNRHKGSLEEFWHSNKVLQLKRDVYEVRSGLK